MRRRKPSLSSTSNRWTVGRLSSMKRGRSLKADSAEAVAVDAAAAAAAATIAAAGAAAVGTAAAEASESLAGNAEGSWPRAQGSGQRAGSADADRPFLFRRLLVYRGGLLLTPQRVDGTHRRGAPRRHITRHQR